MRLKKKLIAATLLLTVSISAIADLQQQVGFGSAAIGSLGVYMAVATGVTVLTGGAAAIGLLGAAILLSTDHSQPASQAAAPLVIQLDPNVPLTTPTGWTNSTTPPSTSPSTIGYTVNQTDLYPSPDAACAANSFSTFTAGQAGPLENGGFYHCSFLDTSNGQRTGAIFLAVQPVTTCPTGYSASGSTCSLTDPSTVKKPVTGQQNIIRSGNTFTQDPQINPADVNPNVHVTSNQVTVNASDGSTTTVTINSDGTSSVTTTAPVSGSTNSQISTTNFGAPTGSGAPISGLSSSTVQGQGNAITSSPAASGSGSSIDVSSLNKEATQLAIKAGQCGGTNEPKCKIDETGTEGASATSETDDSRQRGELNSKFDGLVDQINNQHDGVGDALTNPIIAQVPASECTDPSFDATNVNAGAHATLPLCEHAAEVQPILTWVTYMYTIYAIWSLWFRRVGGVA